MRSIYSTLGLSLFLLVANTMTSNAEGGQSDVITKVTLVPTIHSNHLKKGQFYTTDRLKSIITDLKPDVICAEITAASLVNIDAKKKDSRIARFPEYTKTVIPLREELGFIISPCSAWTAKRNFRTIGVEKMTAEHYKLIAKAIDKHQGKNIIITFGSGHLNGLILHLNKRKDVEIMDFRPELEKLRQQEELKN